MFKKLQRKLESSSTRTKCSVAIDIQKLEGLPQDVKQLKVVWDKDGKVKAASDICTVHKGFADINQVLRQDVTLKRHANAQESFKPKVIVIKIKASKELGAWADMATICKKEFDITSFVEAQSVKEQLTLSMPFTAKFGHSDGVAGCPQMVLSITAQPLGSKDHLWNPAIAKERELSQSSSPPLESPDDIASGLSSDEEEKLGKAEEPAAEKAFLIAQSPRSEQQRDNGEDARRLSEEPLEATSSKADRSDLPRDVSLSSEAEELIAAWNGGKVKYDDGDATAAPQAAHEYHQQDQHTGKEGQEGSMQDNEDSATNGPMDQEAAPMSDADREPSWAELMEEMSVKSRQKSLPPDTDIQHAAQDLPQLKIWKPSKPATSAEPHRPTSSIPTWWEEDQPSKDEAYPGGSPNRFGPDNQATDTASRDFDDSVTGADAEWQIATADPYKESIEPFRDHIADAYEYSGQTPNWTRPQADAYNRAELQDSKQRAEALSRSEGALREEVIALMQQLKHAQVQKDAHALLQKKCADLQWHIDGLEESAQVQEAQYSALEQEHAQLQVQLEAQLEIIADKETQQQQELANAVESLTVAHATQQRLEEVNAAFEQQVGSMSLQLSDMQSKIQSPQKMMQQQQELATALESLQVAHAAQQQLKEDKAALVKEVDSMSRQLSDTQSKLHLAQKASEEAEATSLEFSAQMEALQEELANQREADAGTGTAKGLKAELAFIKEECEAAQAKCKEFQIKKNAADARLSTLQEEADNAMDMAEKATAVLEEERALLAQENKELQEQLTAIQEKQASASLAEQAGNKNSSCHATEASIPETQAELEEGLQHVLKERDELRQLLNDQLTTISTHTARINGLQQNLMDMQNATKVAAQAATEQAARALALYAKDAQELRDQLAQAQAQAESRRTGSFATILKSARRSFLRQDSSAAAPEEDDSRDDRIKRSGDSRPVTISGVQGNQGSS